MSSAPAADRTFALRCIVAGALLMLLGVILGAFGAHALQQMLTQTLRSHVSSRVPRHFSDTPEACLAWLGEQGLGPD